MTECAMCATEIKTSQPIITFSDTLFLPNGRWSEHLSLDNLCSIKCMKGILQDEEGNWLDNTGAISAAEGAECSVCDNKFDAGHIISLGWKKTKREKWHKIVTTRNYCGHKCLTTDLDDKKSPIHRSSIEERR